MSVGLSLETFLSEKNKNHRMRRNNSVSFFFGVSDLNWNWSQTIFHLALESLNKCPIF